MDEINEYVYSVLYRKESLDNNKLLFVPCYVVKGIYDEQEGIFLDELNKSRYSFNDIKVVDENCNYCIGEVYTEQDLRKQIPDANSVEDLLIKFYRKIEENVTIGYCRSDGAGIDISTIDANDYDDDYNEWYVEDYDEKNGNVNGKEYYEYLKEQCGFDFCLFTKSQAKYLISLESDKEIFDFVVTCIEDRYNYYKSEYKIPNNTMAFNVEDLYRVLDNDPSDMREYMKSALDILNDYQQQEEQESSIEKTQITDNNVSIQKVKEEIESAMNKLDNLVGLKEVKEELGEVFDTMLFKKKTEGNLVIDEGSKHMVFLGNPGTGKTTVAEIIAPLFYKLGYLKSDKVAYVAAQDLIGEYIGQTAPKTEKIIEENMGGVIVLDEAYILGSEHQGFGNEAITVMLKEMEKNRTMFIFAGYKKEMQSFMKMNSGLESRIGTFLEFKDYNKEELLEMFNKNLEYVNSNINSKYKLTVNDAAMINIETVIEDAMKIENFGNGRFVKKLFDKVIRCHAKNTRSSNDLKTICRITENDVPNDILKTILFNDSNNTNNIGFKMDTSEKVYKKVGKRI